MPGAGDGDLHCRLRLLHVAFSQNDLCFGFAGHLYLHLVWPEKIELQLSARPMSSSSNKIIATADCIDMLLNLFADL
jgi:hypothetical protein